MYRESVDDSIIFTFEDIILFNDSPFASTMERLTFEYPQHPYTPDTKIPAALLHKSRDSIVPIAWDVLGKQVAARAPEKNIPAPKIFDQANRAGIAQALAKGGKNVAIIDTEIDQSLRCTRTLDAMHAGADFIIDGQLAAGCLSGQASLLMRTSGNSKLGEYLYTACITGPEASSNSIFLLCFLSDLLQKMQGQLPPKMLHIQNGAGLESLQTEEHISHYLAVKQRFITAQNEFSCTDTPDPSLSSQFGRWTNCAKEILMRREAPDLNKPPQACPTVKVSPPDPPLFPPNASLSAPPANLRNLTTTPSHALLSEPGRQTSSLVDRDEMIDDSNHAGKNHRRATVDHD